MFSPLQISYMKSSVSHPPMSSSSDHSSWCSFFSGCNTSVNLFSSENCEPMKIWNGFKEIATAARVRSENYLLTPVKWSDLRRSALLLVRYKTEIPVKYSCVSKDAGASRKRLLKLQLKIHHELNMLAWSDNWMDEFIPGPIDEVQQHLSGLCSRVHSYGCLQIDQF